MAGSAGLTNESNLSEREAPTPAAVKVEIETPLLPPSINAPTNKFQKLLKRSKIRMSKKNSLIQGLKSSPSSPTQMSSTSQNVSEDTVSSKNSSPDQENTEENLSQSEFNVPKYTQRFINPKCSNRLKINHYSHTASNSMNICEKLKKEDLNAP